MAYTDIIVAAGGTILGALLGFYVLRQGKFDENEIKMRGEKLLNHAAAESKKIVAEASTHCVEKKKQFEIEQQEFIAQLDKMEKLLETKIASSKKREEKVEHLKKALLEEDRSVNVLRQETDGIETKVVEQLCRSTGVLRENIREEILKYYENAFKEDAEIRLQRAVQWAQDCAVKASQNVLAQAIYRFEEATSVENFEHRLNVPRDEMKGRIVGRGGHMIGFFENLFGVDVIFNDEPDTIIVSCFNLVQQEVARIALEKLMREKIISEEIIARTKPIAEKEVDKILQKDGERALAILGLKNMPPDFAKLIGRLRFRTSYGQNIMRHCFEVGYFAKLIASEIGADENVAWLGGFFHDIGKAIDQETGGSHDVLSKEILEKYGFSWEIVHAAWTHHNAIPQETVEARIVQAADAISASRPGARAESMERYLTKIKDLQETALSFASAKKAYAINAGRELRVVVDPEKVDDAGAAELAVNIAAKVQEKGGYPGKIKITTIRTTKVTDYAR